VPRTYTPTAMGTRLRALRLEAGKSQSEVARTMGVTRQLVSYIESGRSLPSMPTLERFLAAIGAHWELVRDT
jgi:transcriptional regulator with XRE-family HTH domain